VDENLELECDNKEHVPNWTLTRLKPKNNSERRQMMYDPDEEIEVRTSGEWIADNLALGDNIATLSDNVDPLRVMLVDKGLHFIEDGWGNKW
jgi:hypothetical protein